MDLGGEEKEIQKVSDFLHASRTWYNASVEKLVLMWYTIKEVTKIAKVNTMISLPKQHKDFTNLGLRKPRGSQSFTSTPMASTAVCLTHPKSCFAAVHDLP